MCGSGAWALAIMEAPWMEVVRIHRMVRTEWSVALFCFFLSTGKLQINVSRNGAAQNRSLMCELFKVFSATRRKCDTHRQTHNAGDCGLLTNFQPHSCVRLESKMPLSSSNGPPSHYSGHKKVSVCSWMLLLHVFGHCVCKLKLSCAATDA